MNNAPRWQGKTQRTIEWVRAAVASGRRVLVVGTDGNATVGTWAEFRAWMEWFMRRCPDCGIPRLHPAEEE